MLVTDPSASCRSSLLPVVNALTDKANVIVVILVCGAAGLLARAVLPV